MGAIVSDFYYLAHDDNPSKVDCYQRVNQTLTELGLPLPVSPPEVATHAEMLLHLQTIAGNLLKAELLANPAGHYTGLTDAQIPAAFVTALPGEDEPPRISVVWRAVPYTPNQITEQDVIGAKS